MFAQRAAQPSVFAAGDFFRGDKIAMQNIFGFRAQNVREAAGHAGTEIQAERTENQNDAAGHVFAAVLADAFDHGECAAVANGETFACAAGDKKLAGSCAVQNRVSGENVTAARSAGARTDRDGAAGQSFADVVVGFAVKFEIDSGAEKRAETLTGAAVKFLGDRRAASALPAARSRASSPLRPAPTLRSELRIERNSARRIRDRLRGLASFAERSVNAGHLLRRDAERHVGFECQRRSFRVIRGARPQAIVLAFEFAKRIGAELGQFACGFRRRARGNKQSPFPACR